MHLSPGFTCTSLMGPTCLYAEKQQGERHAFGCAIDFTHSIVLWHALSIFTIATSSAQVLAAGNRASSDNLTMWIHIATDLLVPDPSDKSARANEALPDHSQEGTVPGQPKAGQHQLKTIDSHSKSADAHGCEQLIDAARQTVSPSQLSAAAAEEPASKCAAADSQGGNGIMAQYLAAGQDQLGAVHGRSDPVEKHWQRIGASSEGKLDDVVYVRVGKGGSVQSVYDGSFDGSMDAGGEGETQGVCQSNEKTQE